MTLNEAQQAFAQRVAHLVLHISYNGYRVTLGDAYRDPRSPYGHPHTCHARRLAIDLNLFKDGVYLTTTEAHAPFGAWWKAQHPLARWGGDFRPVPDGNHYSFEWEGIK